MSGKSTLALELLRLLTLSVVHMDHVNWQAGWIERSGPEKDRSGSEVHAQDSWIFEGGRSSTWLDRFARADYPDMAGFPVDDESMAYFSANSSIPWQNTSGLARRLP